MFIGTQAAHRKWYPDMRIGDNDRPHGTMTDGIWNSERIDQGIGVGSGVPAHGCWLTSLLRPDVRSGR